MKIAKNILILLSFVMSSTSYGDGNSAPFAGFLQSKNPTQISFVQNFFDMPMVNPLQSSMHQSPDGLSFIAGEITTPGTCPTPSNEFIQITTLADNVANFSCGISAQKSVTEYCGCIKDKELSSNVDLKKLASDLYASALASKITKAFTSYFKNAEIVGYGQATSNFASEKLASDMKTLNDKRVGSPKYPTCSPQRLEQMLDLLNSKKNKNNKGCLEGVVNEKAIKVLKNKISEKSGSYKKMKDIDLNKTNTLFDIASELDKTISSSFSTGMIAQDYSVTNIFRSKDSLRDLDKYRDSFDKKQKTEFSKLHSIAGRIKNKEELTEEDYDYIAEMYKKNPLLRKLYKIYGIESSDNTPRYGFRPNSINSRNTFVKNKLKDFASRATYSTLSIAPFVYSKDFDKVYDRNQTDVGQLVTAANNECISAFAEVENFCASDEWSYIVDDARPSEFSDILNDIYLVDSASVQDAVSANVDAGHIYCSLYKCKDDAYKNTVECKEPSSTKGEFKTEVVTETESLINSQIEEGDFGRNSSVSSYSVAQVYVDESTGVGMGGELNMDEVTNIVDSTDEEYHAVTGFEKAASTAFSNSTAMAIPKTNIGTTPSTSTSSTISTPDELEFAKDLAQVQEANKEESEVMKELKKVQDELVKTKNEMESSKKELEEIRAKEALAEQQRINEENERKLQSTINSLEDKISKLEKKEADLSSGRAVKNNVTYSNPMNSKGNSLASNSGEQGEVVNEALGSSGSVARATEFSNSDIVKNLRDNQNAKSVLKRLEESRSQIGGSSSGLSILSAQSLDDPSLQTKVREAYQNGIDTIYVNVDGNVYRISPMLDAKGNIVEEDGALKFVTEIATASLIEADELAAQGKDELQRLPASVSDEPLLKSDDPAYRKAQLDALLNSVDGEK